MRPRVVRNIEIGMHLRATGKFDTHEDLLTALLEWMQRLEAKLDLLVQRQAIKDWYSTDEVAQVVGKAEFTVREWCRLGRVRAQKKGSGRGKFQSWVISHA